MASTQYTYCKNNIKSINAGTNDNLKTFCSNVIEVYESKAASTVASAQDYYCESTNGYIGVKFFRKQDGVLTILNGSNYKNVNGAYVPAITVCNQNIY
jgi:hypothetical protein